MRDFIPIARPVIGDEENAAVDEVLRSGMLAQGEAVKRFEDEFAAYLGVKNAIAVNNSEVAFTNYLYPPGYIWDEGRVSGTRIDLGNAGVPLDAAIAKSSLTVMGVDIEETNIDLAKELFKILDVREKGLSYLEPQKSDLLFDLRVEYPIQRK